MSFVLRSILAWVVLLALMIVNGMIRVGVLQPRLGVNAARQVASLAAIAIIFGAAWIFVRVVPSPTRERLIATGVLWLVLTVAFEIAFGRLVVGASWETLLADYNLLRGRLWTLVLLATLVAPVACGNARRTPPADAHDDTNRIAGG